MNNTANLDKRAVRRSFERAAAGYDAAAVLQREVCARMAERLALIKHQSVVLLDAGSGTGNAHRVLRARYPQARIIALDLAWTMLRQSHPSQSQSAVSWWKNLWSPQQMAVCGDMEQLPLASASVDMVWSNLALQWMNQPQQAFAELHRVLKPGGLLMFSTFGPDTLKELRLAWSAADQQPHVSRFIDMHDLGDMLVACPFADPVMDMETFTLTYDSVKAVMHDLKAIGAHNAASDRRQTLSGKSKFVAMSNAYETLRRDGKLPATFEVVYGHAWKPLPRVTASGKKIIEIKAKE